MSVKPKKRTRTSFGATAPPFLDYLKDILRRYPDGGQILKELIQNADDAQATEVVFIHDERSYGTKSLWTEELAKYQGPALYAYNNAAFTDDDWEGIQMAGRSVKRNDPNKVGRFGIGFNSVYHTTDVPSIFSSGHLGLMDPQENIFGERNGGFLWSLDDPEHQEALMTMTDQFQPFRDIVSLVSKRKWSEVVMKDQQFDGTIFRFPLRNEASDISDNIYVSEKVVDLFDSFITDAELSLLFLKNVTSVSLIHINAHGAVNTRLRVTSCVCPDVVQVSAAGPVTESSTRFKLIAIEAETRRETKWLVTTCIMKEGNVDNLDSLAQKLSFFPRVDLAFPCGEKRACSESRLSCFLPLPNNESNRTMLPVYVNACFGLTDNRRHIKWQEEDQKHDEHAVWNELLMREVFPQAYLTIIQDAISLARRSVLPVSSVYDLWPDIAQVQHKDKWLAIALDVLRQLFRLNVAVLSLAKDEQTFITPSDAVFPCNGPTSCDVLAAIRRTLVSCGENLVTLPANVTAAVNRAYPNLHALKHVTPAFLRQILHRTDVDKLSKDDKLCLLEYVLSDGRYRELRGLQLLPRSDGSFRAFTDREEDAALIDTEHFTRVLLPCCKHLFIPEDLRPACRTHLKELAEQKFFKVIKLDADQVAEYTRRFLPQDWMQTETGLVTWDTSNDQHPPLDWIQHFWKYLNNHFSELSHFCGLPLIPINPLSGSQPVLLAKLQRDTTLIFQKSRESTLPDEVAQVVNKVGGTVVGENTWLKHEDLESYVLSPSPNNVIRILLRVDIEPLIDKLKMASHNTREQLKDYLSRSDSRSGQVKDFLSHLPLFLTMKGKCVASYSQAVLQTSGLTLPSELPMPDTVVQCATEADRRLLKMLEVQLLNTAEAAEVLIDCIDRGACRKEDIEKTMTWILQHGNILFSQNQTLKHRCRELSFIEMNGEMKKASDFFDPRVQTFTVVFKSDFFPPQSYANTPQKLASLKELGLLSKEKDVSPQHLLHAATLIEKLGADPQTQTQALQRAQVLLKMLDANDLLSKFSHEQLLHLKTIRWVQCEQPDNDKSQRSCLSCPKEIKHSMYKDIVGHVMPLVDKVSDSVSNKLGLKDRPAPEKVRENLSVLRLKAQKMFDPNANVDFKRKLHSIYKYMQDNMSEFAAVPDMDTNWLWSHKQFVSPRDLVLNYPSDLDLSAYIGKLPQEFLPYKTLLQKFGLRLSLSDEEVIHILYSIHQAVEARLQPSASSSEIKVSIEILNWLWREKKLVRDDVPVPVLAGGKNYTMKQSSSAVFCDVSKNGLNELKNSQDEIHVLHEEIPKATAEWLNVRFLSTYILDPELVGIEQWGQSEPITTRIKNILKEYDEESDIFKELIQNAEDAGAEICRFLVDFRVHHDAPESLIDPDMALCQGPCLWAYNNERFTDLDWKNIVRVGAASKENKAEKIGKFGLGFNTVYHVTDIPSILSGNTLLILDPNVTHLRKHIKHKTNPGLKLDLSKQHLFHCFPGQFGPYEHIFDCSFSRQIPPEPYPGTLIKLPFRTEEEAVKSEISKKVFHQHNINNVQQPFTKNAQAHLLFLKNINALSLQSMSNDSSTPPRDHEITTILTVFKTSVRTMMVPDQSCVSKQRKAKKALIELDGKCKEVIDCCKVQIVQITSQQSGVTEVQSWLIYNCFGTNQSFKMALNGNKQALFSLPIGGVAVPLQSGTLAAPQSDLVGQAFCFLPLSIHTGLPVNVNGTFAVTSNRKGLWESGVKYEWNKALLQDPVVTAYVTVLSALQKMSEDKQLEDYCYYTFWPDRAKVNETFKPLVDAFYATVAQDNRELFSDGERWCSIDNAIFLHEAVEKDKVVNALVVQVCRTYIKPPNQVVPLPTWLRNNFKEAGLENVLQKRTWDWKRFYQEIVFNNLGTMDSVTRDTFVLHAIDLQIKDVDDLLVSYPCIPTRGGQLQYISKLVNPSGRAACLFEPEEGRLLGGTAKDFCCPRRIQRLLDLGMTNDNLPMKDLAEKARAISQTWGTSRSKATEKLKCLLDLLKSHMYEESSHWETLRMTHFLPAFTAGTRNVALRRPSDVFKDKCSLLVNMIQPVLDHSSLNIHNDDPILKILGVRNSPSPENVLDQLQEACKQAHTTDTNILNKIAYECYKFLDQWISNNGISASMSQRANSFPFILVGNKFVNVASVAEDEQFEAKPYLHMLPSAFIGFRSLWNSLGVERKFTINQFRSVFLQLRTKYGRNPLPTSDLSMCLTMLNTGIFQAKEKTADDFLIPNTRGVLQPANELFYNDSPWMPVAEGITLCHEHISRPMARHFKIKTTRHHTLQNHIAENISPFAFEFEQKEKLTVRIKNIISAYPSKKDILKELLQNADDAGATEIHFVWDKRHHGKDKTFGKRWNPLQGPALCVFNNKVFSDMDLHGIQQLGEGGKHSSPGKTGKYGVGFNSVYHLTDCPSILTGDKLLCISDPNQKYIESHSEKPSGIGYKLDDTFKKMYIDVYNSFLPNQFELEVGTMFRLPLRIGTMANSSEITQEGVTDRDMKELMSALSEDPEGLILFLKNICKINVHEIDGTLEKLKNIYSVEKSIPQTSREKKDEFEKCLQNALQSDRPVPNKGIYGTTISTSDKRKTNWIIAEQFGSDRNLDGKEMSSVKKLPQAAIAARVSRKSEIPMSYFSATDFSGAAFCSLPLPGKTGLPVHVNANFEVDAARRGLWKEDGQSIKAKWNEALKINIIAPLYADLLHYISCSITEKKVTRVIGDFFNRTYLCFWPSVTEHVGQDWHEMIHEVYRSVKGRGLDVIPVIKSSSRVAAGRNIKEYSFDRCNVIDTEPTKAPHLAEPHDDSLNDILEDLGMKLVPFSDEMHKVWKGFKSAGIDLKEVNPSSVQAFLREKPLGDPNQTHKGLPLHINATLIRNEATCAKLLSFCLKDLSLQTILKKNPSFLNGLPLLLTKDKVLRVFNSDSPKLISRYDNLFVGFEEKFADFLTNEDHIGVLESCKVVNKLTLRSAVTDLKPLSQRLLQKCELDPHSGLRSPDETMLKWLKSLWEYLIGEVTLSSTSTTDEKSVTISDVRQLFSDCCILPVVSPRLNNKSFLTTMKDMPSVIHFSSDRDVSGILFKLGFLKFNGVFLREILLDRQFHSLLHHELMDVKDPSSVLDQVYKVQHSEFSQLSSEEMKELQTFLQSGICKAKDTQMYQTQLKSLPIFETIHGKRVRIDGLKPVYFLRSSLLTTFADVFSMSSNDSIFLKDTIENHSLCETLGISVLTDLTYFMKFILPVVRSLSESQTLCCLKLLLFLQHDYSYPTHNDQIISSMKTVKLIRSSKGSLEMASYYFDESVELFKKMLPQERFVPKGFWTMMCNGNVQQQEQLTTLLKELGMKHVVSEDDLVNFAKQLESEIKGNGQLDDLKVKSRLVLQETLSAINKQDNPLKSIADIKFIFPVVIQKALCDYHQPFATEGTAVKIRGSLIETGENHQELIWSSMPIIHLPVYLSKRILQMMKDAGAHDQPPLECVTRNMINICQSPCKTNALIQTRAKVFRSSYVYLQANKFKSDQLAGLPVVLVEKDKELVRTDAVCLTLKCNEDFRPYLFQISPQDVLFTEFFKTIGVNENPTAVQYCNVLAAVYAETRAKKQLQANQMLTVRRAVQQLFWLIKESKSNIDDVHTLYLPAADGKLQSSCELYYNDTVFNVKRLEEVLDQRFTLLEKLSECHLGNDTYKHSEFLQMLPQRLQPRMLSQLTEERVDESKIQLCEFDTGCEFRGWFDKHLSSRAFRHGLICLIRHHSKGKTSHNEAADMCKQTFGSIRILCCKSLKTQLWLNNSPLHKTARETAVYVKQEQQGCMFYLKHNDHLPHKVINNICITLTKEINALLNNRIASHHLLALGQLLMCDSLEEVQEILAEHDIRESIEAKSGLFTPPAPGTDIPEEWHDALDMDILNNLEEGEYVGYNTDDKYIYAIIVKELPGQSGQYSRRYLIDIGGDEPVEVSCLDLFQFKREKKQRPEGRTDPDLSAEATCMELEPLAGGVPHFSQPSSAPRSSPASLDEAKKEIDKCLAEIWSLPKDERVKAIKRLYLRWHPDKNPDCQFIATEAFKYLKNQIEALSKGKAKTSGSPGPRAPDNSYFRDFYQQWNQEARHHRTSRERFRSSSYNFWDFYEDVPRPDREEAQRWFRQARCDLQAADSDRGRSTEWCLFKVHQAVKKALIAAQYKKCGQQSSSDSISAMASKVALYSSQLRVLPHLVAGLQRVGVDAQKTQYPNCHPKPHIPNERFKPEDETEAVRKASELLSIVQAYIC